MPPAPRNVVNTTQVVFTNSGGPYNTARSAAPWARHVYRTGPVEGMSSVGAAWKGCDQNMPLLRSLFRGGREFYKHAAPLALRNTPRSFPVSVNHS
jgi:hypothetical protein